MKSILYVGATLMIGASIYGFVDYKKTSPRNEFTKMYDAKEDPPAAVVKKKEVAVKDQPAVVEKVVIKKEEPVKTEKVIKETKVVASNEVKAEKKSAPVKKKKLSYKLYSRAAPAERFTHKELKEEPIKVENKQ